MILEKIISFANKSSQLRFLAMERSLRATGCDLPVWVIPYDDNRFDLPHNCLWWEMDEVTSLLKENELHCMKRKFQCFLTTNYQYVDADVIFLNNPQNTLKEHTGFITSCCHWNNPEHTFVPSTLKMFKDKSTTWQKSIFNSGQFACDKALYNMETLKEVVINPKHREALNSHDQISINLFVFLSEVKISNITLPPYNMESTWAGDYPDEDFRKYWLDNSKKPYLIHWAGYKVAVDKPIDKLFTAYLTKAEYEDLINQLDTYKETFKQHKKRKVFPWFKQIIKRLINYRAHN